MSGTHTHTKSNGRKKMSLASEATKALCSSLIDAPFWTLYVSEVVQVGRQPHVYDRGAWRGIVSLARHERSIRAPFKGAVALFLSRSLPLLLRASYHQLFIGETSSGDDKDTSDAGSSTLLARLKSVKHRHPRLFRFISLLFRIVDALLCHVFECVAFRMMTARTRDAVSVQSALRAGFARRDLLCGAALTVAKHWTGSDSLSLGRLALLLAESARLRAMVRGRWTLPVLRSMLTSGTWRQLFAGMRVRLITAPPHLLLYAAVGWILSKLSITSS
jgi:hypothetical protein